MPISTAQQGRIDKVLNKVMRFDEGVMSCREWLLLQIKNGRTVSTEEVPAIKFDRRKYNSLGGKEQEKYEEDLKRTKIGYKLHFGDGTSVAIAKIEYDFFLANGGKAK